MLRRVGEWTQVERARLPNYKLVFNVESTRWGGSTANIVETGLANDIVYGAVYKLMKEKMQVLSQYENSEPTAIKAILENGSIASALTYLWNRDRESRPPPVAYANTIVQGLCQHGYPAETIQSVKSLMDLDNNRP